MKIAVGSDHRGYEAKERIKALVQELGVTVVDHGTDSRSSCDYPDMGLAVACDVSAGRVDRGILFCGSGVGMSITANKVPGVRAALCYDLSSARNSREHNHANVLTLGAGLIGDGLARQIVDEWLATPWGPDRHARRVAKITAIEQRYLRAGAEK